MSEPSGAARRHARTCIRVAAIAVMASLAAALPCAALEISRVAACHGDVLKLRGDIKRGDYVKFRSYFDDRRRIIGLDLNSSGGLLSEGFRIAALTRQKRLSTFVANECDSACAFIFFLGRKRYVTSEARIGVHAVGNDFGAEDNGTIRDTIYFARLSAKLGIPSSTIGKMVSTPPARITLLDQADLSALKVIVRNPFTYEGPEGRNCASDPATEETSATARRPVSHAGISDSPASKALPPLSRSATNETTISRKRMLDQRDSNPRRKINREWHPHLTIKH